LRNLRGAQHQQFQSLLPAARHGIARIYNQVDEDLLKLARVGLYSPDHGRQNWNDIDVRWY
jgi:hypothetical protein